MHLLAAYSDRVLAFEDGSLATEFEGDVQCIDGGPYGVYVGASDGVHRRDDGDW